MAFDTHGVNGKPWTGFDLDGTLAVYDKWRGVANIGKPVRPMCELIRKMHDEGKSVKILTARVAPREDGSHHLARVFIARWCRDNLGFVPPITHEKDALMETLYDDRVKAVEQNTGKVLNMAKFKKGDRVVATKPDYQTKGVGVVRGYEYSWDEEIERDDPGWYIVDFPNQYKVKMGKGSLRLANSAVRSRAARNAEFKPGDVVSYRSANGMTWTGIVKSDMNGWCKPDEILVLRTGDTKPHVIPKRAVIPNSLRSRNAVVAKALNARRVARNFTPQSEFQVGDVVRFRDSVRSVPHDETYTVVKVSGNNITIKGGRDNGTSVEFKNNLEIA